MAKIMFIQKDWYENLGVMQLSSVLKSHGHDCTLAFHFNNKQVFREVLQYQPSIIAFSLMTIEASFVSSVASYLKKKGVVSLIIAGGSHPTFYPEFVNNECIDAINVGEGERSFLQVANSIDNGKPLNFIDNLHVKVKGVLYRNPVGPLCDINLLPDPDRSIYLSYSYFRTLGTYSFIISRGCPYKCNFCFNHTWTKLYSHTKNYEYLRLKDVERCIREIKNLAKTVKISSISFNDSTFNLNNKWAIEFFDVYRKELSIPFSLNIRPKRLNQELLKAIKATNSCHLIRIGVEVGNEHVRMNVLNKNIRNIDIIESVTLIKNNGIRICTYNMFGVPGETISDSIKTIELNQKLKPHASIPSIFMPLPGTEITDTAITNGLIDIKGAVVSDSLTMIPVDSALDQPDIEHVLKLSKLSNYAISTPRLGKTIIKYSKYIPMPIINALSYLDLFIQNRKQFGLPLKSTVVIIIYYALSKLGINPPKFVLKRRY